MSGHCWPNVIPFTSRAPAFCVYSECTCRSSLYFSTVCSPAASSIFICHTNISCPLIFTHPTSVSIHRHPISLHTTAFTINIHFHPTKLKKKNTQKILSALKRPFFSLLSYLSSQSTPPKLHPAPAAPPPTHIHNPSPRSSKMGRAGYDTTYVCTTTDSAATTAIAMADAQRAKDAVRTHTHTHTHSKRLSRPTHFNTRLTLRSLAENSRTSSKSSHRSQTHQKQAFAWDRGM